MDNFKKTLQENRPLLLGLEAVGWLHMTGKAKREFLQEHGGQKTGYDYKTWYNNKENPSFPWNDLLQWMRSEQYGLHDKLPHELTDFLSKHTEKSGKLLGLLQAGHAMASGIEKNVPNETTKYLNQDITHMWLSSSFGAPERNLLADPPNLLSAAGWQNLLDKIEKLLRDLVALAVPPPPHTSDDIEGWWQWREEAVGKLRDHNYQSGNCWWQWREEAVGKQGWLRRVFSSTLAETRLPNNDVTLFDQSYVAAALFKSAVAGALLAGKDFQWDNNIKQSTRWRLLSVGIGAKHYEARAVRIGDWTGAWLALKGFFERVRRFVEVDLAIGSLLYADSQMLVFSFPGEQKDKSWDQKMIKSWETVLTEEINCYAHRLHLETPPYCKISAPSRSLVLMTKEIEKARETMAVPIFRTWSVPGASKDDIEEPRATGHVCPVCLVRYNGNASSKEQPCRICKERRERRLDYWLQGKLGTDTLWISELADAHDRVALLTMSLDIEEWLTGARLDSLRAQAIAEWRKNNTVLSNFWDNNTEKMENPINTKKSFISLQEEIEKKLDKEFEPKDLFLANLQEGYRYGKDWKSYFSLIVEDRVPERQPQWKEDDFNHNARWLAHQFFRKLASPGRIYRFQRQAEGFFHDLLTSFREISSAHPNRWRTRRLLIKGNGGGWQNRQSYAGHYKGAPLELLYREETTDFITICNLARLLEANEGANDLKKEPTRENIIKLRASDVDYRGNQQELSLTITTITEEKDTGELGAYHPLIHLEVSPQRFRVLLPLEAASECVDKALQAWDEQFAGVWDRLPLRIGVVAFSRKTPFQVVIETARNIETELYRSNQEAEYWCVKDSETRQGITKIALEAVKGKGKMLRSIPTRLPDGREDVFYPYLALTDNEVRFPLDFRHPEGQVYRQAKELQKGDKIRVYPARIVTLFLDGSSERFEGVAKWEHRLAEWQDMRALWQMLEHLAPSQSALRGLWADLSQHREAWQDGEREWLKGGKEGWLALARAMFAHRLGARGADLATLEEAASSGLWDWCLEWHLSILKKQVSGGNNDGRE